METWRFIIIITFCRCLFPHSFSVLVHRRHTRFSILGVFACVSVIHHLIVVFQIWRSIWASFIFNILSPTFEIEILIFGFLAVSRFWIEMACHLIQAGYVGSIDGWQSSVFGQLFIICKVGQVLLQWFWCVCSLFLFFTVFFEIRIDIEIITILIWTQHNISAFLCLIIGTIWMLRVWSMMGAKELGEINVLHCWAAVVGIVNVECQWWLVRHDRVIRGIPPVFSA